VVDSESRDRTREVAEAMGARVVPFAFSGTWPKKKNWALENLPFANEWVLILDADEEMPPGSEREIAAVVGREGGPDGYWINRRFWFAGHRLRHAYYPNWNLRLFRHRLGRYEKITGAATDSGDNEVHEHVIVRGATARLRAEMNHYAFPSVGVFIEKHNRYSNWEACVAAEEEDIAAIQDPAVRARRRLKRLFRLLPFRPFARFLYVYVWQRGFLDGKAGYYFARLHAMYELMNVMKTWEKDAPR
jgi:glycosyltransferase involved in cell wall biosynthesis